MPLDAEGGWRRDKVVPSEDVLARIDDRWPIEAIRPPDGNPAPADRYRFCDGAGEVGVVASVTRPFCGTCNRLRLTADGAIRNCLFSDDEVSVRSVLRSGGSDEDIALAVRRAVWGKLPGHGINDPGFLRPSRSMSMIGG
jgi:cyclic pyranopterin phosphate synthase